MLLRHVEMTRSSDKNIFIYTSRDYAGICSKDRNLCADQIETSTSPPPPGKPRAFDYFLCPGEGNLTGKAFPGVGNLTLPGWGGEN